METFATFEDRIKKETHYRTRKNVRGTYYFGEYLSQRALKVKMNDDSRNVSYHRQSHYSAARPTSDQSPFRVVILYINIEVSKELSYPFWPEHSAEHVFTMSSIQSLFAPSDNLICGSVAL